MRKKSISLFLAILLLLPVLTVFTPTVQASSQTYWQAPLPYEDVILNQTLSTNQLGAYAEAGLSANLYHIDKDPYGGAYEFDIAVVGVANSRVGMDFSTEYHSYMMEDPPNTLSLGDDAGAWVDTGWVWINYYGAWYNRVFITSNGFIVLDSDAYNDNGAKWTSPIPKTIPSTDDPNLVIAPFWRDLDPSQGGTIKYGITRYMGWYGFAVKWMNVPNWANPNIQTFGVFISAPDTHSVSHLAFIYTSITNDVSTSKGFEDQAGRSGESISSVSSGQSVDFIPYFPNNNIGITNIKLSASKLTDAGANDNKASILLTGMEAGDVYPGGVNVQLYDPQQGRYDEPPVVSAVDVIIGGLSLLCTRVAPYLGPLGLVLDAAALANELSPVPTSTLQQAGENTQTAFMSNVARDENHPDVLPWDVAVFALVHWKFNDVNVNHRLVINLQVDFSYGAPQIVTNNLELKLTPGTNVSWYGRTNPDAHYYNFYQISTPYGTGYHIDTIGSSDYNYQMLGWSKLTDDQPEDYKVKADGTITIEGYFRQSDTLYSDLQPGRRLVYIYIMYSDNLNLIVKTAQILSYTDGTDWRFKSLAIGGLIPGKAVKVGIGRPDYWSWDWQLVVEWASIQINTGGNQAPNTPSTPSGPTSLIMNKYYTYSTSTTDPEGDQVSYEFDWGDGTTTMTGYYASGATASASHKWTSDGGYAIRVRAKDSHEFWSGYSSFLRVTVTRPMCPTLFSWNGTAYEEEGLLNIHNASDMTLDVSLSHLIPAGNLARLSLRELDNFTSHIDNLKLFVIDANGLQRECRLIFGLHNQLGLVTADLLYDDSLRVNLAPTERIEVAFLIPNDVSSIQSFTFEINGYNAKPS